MTEKDGRQNVQKPPRTKYQIFISSTFGDLREEREAVSWEILKARHIPAGMEIFPATDDRGWKIIQKTIKDSDYYVLLIAGRYGSLDEETGLSWTEKEYQYARELEIPVLAFIREDSEITKAKMDEGKKAEKLKRFILRVKDEHLCQSWKKSSDLCAKVAHSLSAQIQDDEDDGNARPGWYRGGQFASAEVVEEMTKLSAENRRMRERLEALEEKRNPKLYMGVTKESVGNGIIRIKKNIIRLEDELPVEQYSPVPPEIRALQRVNKLPRRAYEKFVNQINRTFWLPMSIVNKGSQSAKDIVVDILCRDSKKILIESREAPTLKPLLQYSKVPDRKKDHTKRVYVDAIDESGPRIRQLVKSINVDMDEHLVPFGVEFKFWDSNSPKRFNLQCTLSCDGSAPVVETVEVEACVGEEIEISLDKIEKYEEERYPAHISIQQHIQEDPDDAI